ncbi:nucleoprotein TPR-like [Arctopsyche grandis]|uniref:nucleoprotein TPR-like n=1 Tax=Arctopsyche grandis TaxID=121162 RepID=UPI00406D9ED9
MDEEANKEVNAPQSPPSQPSSPAAPPTPPSPHSPHLPTATSPTSTPTPTPTPTLPAAIPTHDSPQPQENPSETPQEGPHPEENQPQSPQNVPTAQDAQQPQVSEQVDALPQDVPTEELNVKIDEQTTAAAPDILQEDVQEEIVESMEVSQVEADPVEADPVEADPIESIDNLKSQLHELSCKLAVSEERQRKDRENSEAYQQQRDGAVRECNTLMDMISRLNSEIVNLNETLSKTSTQLKNAIDSKCEIISKNDELKTKELSLQYREELMEREKTILNEANQNLSTELSKKNLELETFRINQFWKVGSLETQLAQKTEEVSIADEDIAHLRRERLTLIAEVEDLHRKLDEQREAENKLCDELQKKLDSKTKIADVYKNMRDDSDSKCTELVNGVTELQKLLNEAVEKYGELESKNLQMDMDHEAIIMQKNSMIASLKEDLENARQDSKCTKTERIHSNLKDISPTAAVAREFIKSGLSLQEIYAQLMHVSDELARETNENAQLKEALNMIMSDLEEKAPFIQRQISQNEQILDSNSVITQQLETVELEYNQLKDDYAESMKLSNHFERENKRLKDELVDLGRQVCFLLKEVEVSRGGNLYGDKDISTSTSASEFSSSQIISKNLVTFGDIQEIQANNQKLLRLVRDLTEKQEECESIKDQFDSGELQVKLESLNDKIAELSNCKERQMKTISGLIRQRDMYKKLNHEKLRDSSMNIDTGENDELDTANKESADQSKVHNESASSQMKMKLLEEQLEDVKKQLHLEQEHHKKYESLTDSKEKSLLAQVDRLKKELAEVSETYKKFYCAAEAHSEKNKTLQNEIAIQKKKNAILEDKSGKCSTKLAEYEMNNKYLQQKVSISENKVLQNETILGNLQKESQYLKELKGVLLKEKDELNEKLRHQSTLIANFETIKDIVEKKQTNDKTKFENKLDEFTRECSLLRRKLEEKQVGFSAENGNVGDKSEVEKMKLELNNARQELEIKSQQLNELKDLAGEHGQSRAQLKTLNSKLNEKQLEVDSIQQQLIDSREHIKNITAISENAEKELKKLNDQFNIYKAVTDTKLAEYECFMANLKDKCGELEAEISLQNTNQDELINEVKAQLVQAEDNIKNISLQLFEKTSSLDEVQAECLKTTDRINVLSEENSALGVSLAESTQKNSQLQTQVISLNQQITELTCSNVQSEERFNENAKSWEENVQRLLAEKEQSDLALVEMKHQNTLLHDQIEVFNAQYIMSKKLKQPEDLNESSLGESAANASVLDSDNKSHLLQIIRYLRKERDVHSRKLDTMREENLKIKSELESAQSDLNDLKKSQDGNKDESQLNVSLTHSEIVQKFESLNEMTVSNSLLRDERDKSLDTIKSLSQKLKELEESVALLQSNNVTLNKRINSTIVEKNCISAECSRWKTRVSTLLEKTNKTNPEDWKRLQNERESLAKMLTNEKENVKKLREEAVMSKLEKSRLEEQVHALNSQLGNLSDENKKQTADLRHDIAKLSSELNDIKSTLKDRTEEISKLNENITAANNLAAESKNKETQIRKIAKQYKNQYETLFKSVEEDKKKLESTVAESAQLSTGQSDAQKELEQKIVDLERANTEKTAELEVQVASSLEKYDTLQKEIATLRTKNEELEEKAKLTLKQAKTKIFILTESKENLTKELNEVKAKVEAFEQNKDEHDVRLTALKSQYDGRIVKLEKEKTQLLQTQQNEVAQLNKQIEALVQKNAQIQKQVDTLISKPSTSSNQGEKSGSEPPTANIKPMAGTPTSVANRRMGGDTPLASIKPMTSISGVRTAAVLPTTVTSHQSPHTTGNVISDVISSSPSSSHATEYLPSSSSTANRLHQPLQQHSTPPESSQTVALVSPRMETPVVDATVTQLSSTSNNGSSSTVTTSYSNVAERQDSDGGNSNTAQKRSRDDLSDEKHNLKRPKVQKTSCEAEYQVSTSSQKDQDDSVIVVDSEDEENDYEESNLYIAQDESENDDEEVEEEDEVEEEENDDEEDDDDEDDDDEVEDEENEAVNDEEKDGENEEIVEEEEMNAEEEEEGVENEESDREVDYQKDSDEEMDDEEGSDSPNKKSNISNVELIDDTSQENNEEVQKTSTTIPSLQTSAERPQSISNNPANSSHTFFVLRAAGSGISSNVTGHTYEEGDDGIVPSTPTLYMPTRNDGFGEAVRSPTAENAQTGRFSFSSSNTEGTGGVLENTHADLTAQLSSHQSRNDLSSSNRGESDLDNFDNGEGNEAVRNLEASFAQD